jgi:hypothetical protein
VRDEPLALPFWVRGVFRFDDGRELTRTIRSEVVAVPGALTVEHSMERLIAVLRDEGYDFPEGHGALVELLGTMRG